MTGRQDRVGRGRGGEVEVLLAEVPDAEAAPVREVAFELDCFEWADERLEVAGRWKGLAGRRLNRPVLTVGIFVGLQLAYLFVLYEIAGMVTNLSAGWIAARFGLTSTLTSEPSRRTPGWCSSWPRP